MLSQPGKPRAVGGGMGKHLTQTLAYSNEMHGLAARLTKLSNSMTLSGASAAGGMCVRIPVRRRAADSPTTSPSRLPFTSTPRD